TCPGAFKVYRRWMRHRGRGAVPVPWGGGLGTAPARGRHGGRYRGQMPNEDTAPIPLQSPVVRPGPRAVAFLAASGLLLIASTFLTLVPLPLPGVEAGSQPTITAWGMDLGIGHSIQQYIGVVTLIAGVALIVVAAASLRPGFGWTRNA